MVKNEFEFNFRHKTVFLIFIGFIFAVLVALRPIGFDRDSLVYLRLFNTLTNGGVVTSLSVISSTDIGFVLIAALANFFNTGFRGLLFIYSLLAFSLKIYAIAKQAIYPYLSFFIYVTAFMLLHEVTQIRVAVSIGFFLLALPDLFKKKYFVYIIKIIPAILFHYSAFFLLLLPLIASVRVNHVCYGLFPIILLFLTELGVSLFIFFKTTISLLPSFLLNKINIYLTLLSDNYEKVNPYSFAHVSMFLLYYFLFYANKYLASDYDRFLVKILFYGICSFYLFSFLPVFAVRISGYLSTVLIILLPNSVYAIQEKRLMALGLFFVFTLGFVYYFSILTAPVFSI